MIAIRHDIFLHIRSRGHYCKREQFSFFISPPLPLFFLHAERTQEGNGKHGRGSTKRDTHRAKEGCSPSVQCDGVRSRGNEMLFYIYIHKKIDPLPKERVLLLRQCGRLLSAKRGRRVALCVFVPKYKNEQIEMALLCQLHYCTSIWNVFPKREGGG